MDAFIDENTGFLVSQIWELAYYIDLPVEYHTNYTANSV